MTAIQTELSITTNTNSPMKIQRPKFSQNINADIAVGVIDRNIRALTGVEAPVYTFFDFSGVHERTAKGDALSVNISSTSKRNAIRYQLKRDSLYHILPEYLFHPLDRYADTDGDKEVFLEKRAAQKKIETEAKEYFYPYDKILNNLRIGFQHHLNDKILDNEAFIIDFIIENEDVNKENPFIKACLPYVTLLRANRGSSSLLSLALKMTFGNGLRSFRSRFVEYPVRIDSDSCHICLDGTIDDLFCGEKFVDWIEVISVRYQTRISSSGEIEILTKFIEEFRSFFKRWFLSDNQMIEIEFGDYGKIPVISDNKSEGFLYLNFNTQLLVS